MKILITGGLGFLGSNLAAKASKAGHQIYIFDNHSRTGALENKRWLQENYPDIEVQLGDVSNFEVAKDSFQKFQPDAVAHLAGQVAMTTSISDPMLDFNTNALGTVNVLKCILESEKKIPILYSSTNKVYGDLEQFDYDIKGLRYQCLNFPNGFDESIPLEFHSPYGCSKGAADQYILDFHRIYDIPGIVFRHSSIYGGRQFSTADQGWIGWFCKQALLIKQGQIDQIEISGTGNQVRDLLFADDAVSLYLKAIESSESLKGNAFNIGGGMSNSLSLNELFVMLEKKLGIDISIKRNENRASDQKVFVANTQKIESYLTWSPKISKDQGIDRMIEWVQSQQ
jgi:CDP-paratose 2-epimerase